MAKRRGGLGTRLTRLLARLGGPKEPRVKEPRKDAGARDRPWGGQSCPDLAQGSTSNLSLQVQTQSRSEWDLRAGSRASWLGRRRHSSGGLAQPLGRLWRPAVGSASDLASYANLGPEDLALAVASAEPPCSQSLLCPAPASGCFEQGPPDCAAPEVSLRPKVPSNMEGVLSLPRPASLPTAEGPKGKPVTPGLAEAQPAQTLHSGPSTRRTRYHITVTLQECRRAPKEEAEEPKPAQPDPHPCGSEESRGWREPPQEPRPIPGCPTDLPQESWLRVRRHQGSEAQWQEFPIRRTPGSPHRLRELDHCEWRTPLGPGMEEEDGPPARAEARVVSATLVWRQRPPAQEENRHRLHKVSLVSGTQEDGSWEVTEHSHRREEVNGFVSREEETVYHQGAQGGPAWSFQSHEPIFSKRYAPPPKERRPAGRLKMAVGQRDGSLQPPRTTETPGPGALARSEFLVAQPGPREPSPHPAMGLAIQASQMPEEQRVTRTVRTTTVVAGQVDRRVNSSVTMRPVLSGEALPRGRNAVRTVRGVVVRPRAEGSPSHSQALELLTSLVPPECNPPASRLPRPTLIVPQSPALGGPGGAVPEQLPENETPEPKDRAALDPGGFPVGPYPPHSQHVPAAHPEQDQGKALKTRTQEVPRVPRASSPTQLSLQTSRDRTAGPSAPRLQTSLGLAHRPEQLAVPTHPRTQHTLEPRESHDLHPGKREELTDPPAATSHPVLRNKVSVASTQLPAPSSTKRQPAPSPAGIALPASPSSTAAPAQEDSPVFSLVQKEGTQGPAGPPPKAVKVAQGPEDHFSSASAPKEVVKGTEGCLAPSLTKEEVVQGPVAPALPSLKQEEVAGGSQGSPSTSPTQTEAVQDSGAAPAPFATPNVVVQGPAAIPVPSFSIDKVSPGAEGPPAPMPLGTEASLKSQCVTDSKDQLLPEPAREEEEQALAADLEIFLDTLRSMEPPEILRTHRLPRAPRSSYLAMYATLPAIEEGPPGPWVMEPSPQEVPALKEEEEEEEEEEEPENPYLSDEEKLQHRQEKAGPSPSWDPLPARPPQNFRSPLEMMKQHVAGTKSSPLGQALEGQANNRPTSRLGGSLLFGGLVPTAKEAPTLEPLGTKLSALTPHRPLGLRRVSGQLSLLCSESSAPEKLPPSQPLERRSPALKTQGKLNTRPGKMILFSEPSCQGSSKEIWEDIPDASGWLPVASVRVVRGCWVLYEEPGFQGRKLVLPEGDAELQAPRSEWNSKSIGSLRRVVQDYCTPEISLFSEEGLKGEHVKLTQALEDPQGLGHPLQVASVAVSAGLWLLYPKPSFGDTPCILEPGEYPTLEACGTASPTVGSLKPLTLGCPSVERPGEPKAVVFEAPGFQGQSWEVSRDIYNLRKPEDSKSPHLASVGSLQILGGCWVGYEKEGFRGHQYLLEEGEYADWSRWGGFDEVLASLRVIRTDFGDPSVVLFEAMDFEGPGVEVSEALADVELAGHGPHTQAIHVLSGVWVAYQDVGFSGEQYVLEKGVYRNCDDWGSGNSALASLQPVLQVGEHNLHFVSKIQLFSSPDFLGDHISFEDDQASLPASFQAQSCRVHGGSWILFDDKNFEGDQYILSEGEFPTLTAMGCLASTVLGSLQKVPLHFSEPSLFLYGLECFEGKEIELSGEVRSLQAEGFNNHVLSVQIKGGIWVLCEHSDFRGRQWLVGSCEITNWLTYSGTQRVGSLYPIKQRRAYFRLWNAALGGFLAVPDHVEDMKAGRVVVSEPRAGGSCIWYYEEGLLKNQVAPTMSLQVIGPPSSGSKVVLWAESRLPRQTWSIKESGHICSQMFEGRILDVKGGRGYDRDHVVLWEPTKDRASQIWTIHVL